VRGDRHERAVVALARGVHALHQRRAPAQRDQPAGLPLAGGPGREVRLLPTTTTSPVRWCSGAGSSTPQRPRGAPRSEAWPARPPPLSQARKLRPSTTKPSPTPVPHFTAASAWTARWRRTSARRRLAPSTSR
jgi:hypothetical protein